MKLIVTSAKSLFPNEALIKILEERDAIFYENELVDLTDIAELYSEEESILAFDEIRVQGGFASVNHHLKSFRNVRFICGISSRFHEFDVEKATKLGITYCNNPDTTTQSVAELAIMHLMTLVRNYPLTFRNDFDFYGFHHPGRELRALTVGILGFGNIGSKIASLCSNLGMQVAIWSRTQKNSEYKQVSLQEILTQDVIFIALPLEKETQKLFSNDFFSSLRNDHYIIDVSASDDLYDKNRLIRMANSGEIAGFGFEQEFESSRYESISGNISSTPHIGYLTKESYLRWYTGWTNTIVSCFEGKPINMVNNILR